MQNQPPGGWVEPPSPPTKDDVIAVLRVQIEMLNERAGQQLEDIAELRLALSASRAREDGTAFRAGVEAARAALLPTHPAGFGDGPCHHRECMVLAVATGEIEPHETCGPMCEVLRAAFHSSVTPPERAQIQSLPPLRLMSDVHEQDDTATWLVWLHGDRVILSQPGDASKTANAMSAAEARLLAATLMHAADRVSLAPAPETGDDLVRVRRTLIETRLVERELANVYHEARELVGDVRRVRELLRSGALWSNKVAEYHRADGAVARRVQSLEAALAGVEAAVSRRTLLNLDDWS